MPTTRVTPQPTRLSGAIERMTNARTPARATSRSAANSAMLQAPISTTADAVSIAVTVERPREPFRDQRNAHQPKYQRDTESLHTVPAGCRFAHWRKKWRKQRAVENRTGQK
jgi:hypothetical protein